MTVNWQVNKLVEKPLSGMLNRARNSKFAFRCIVGNLVADTSIELFGIGDAENVRR
jgi:hypothetical protein